MGGETTLATMRKRFVSVPLLKMLKASDLTPGAVQEAIALRAPKPGYAVLHAGHAYVTRMRNATGLNVTNIAWRYGRLLVSVEQIKDGGIQWFYREFNSADCSFRCRGDLAGAIVVAMYERKLSVVTDTIAPLLDVTIAGEDDRYSSAGWSSLRLAPEWVRF